MFFLNGYAATEVATPLTKVDHPKPTVNDNSSHHDGEIIRRR